MSNGLEPTGSFQLQPPEEVKPKSNRILVVVLALLVVALFVVGFLVYRRYSGGSDTRGVTPGIQLPAGTRSLDSYTEERAWQEGDPTPESGNPDGGFEASSPGETNTQ